MCPYLLSASMAIPSKQKATNIVGSRPIASDTQPKQPGWAPMRFQAASRVLSAALRRSCYSGAKTCLVSSNLVQAEIFARATTP